MANVLLIIMVLYIKAHALEYMHSVQPNFILKAPTEDSLW